MSRAAGRAPSDPAAPPVTVSGPVESATPRALAPPVFCTEIATVAVWPRSMADPPDGPESDTAVTESAAAVCTVAGRVEIDAVASVAEVFASLPEARVVSATVPGAD